MSVANEKRKENHFRGLTEMVKEKIMRAEYIDREAILKNLPDDLPYKASVKRVLIQAPAADVVEVVRCKECKYFTGKDYDGCCIKNGLATRYLNDFCSYGERKE